MQFSISLGVENLLSYVRSMLRKLCQGLARTCLSSHISWGSWTTHSCPGEKEDREAQERVLSTPHDAKEPEHLSRSHHLMCPPPAKGLQKRKPSLSVVAPALTGTKIIACPCWGKSMASCPCHSGQSSQGHQGMSEFLAPVP